jgi:uncharacterized membrane protein HdeD (DUF308 family)
MEIETCDEWEVYMLVHHGKLGEFVVCHLCHSHWVAFLLSWLVMLVGGLAVFWLPFFAMFTAPWFVGKLID